MQEIRDEHHQHGRCRICTANDPDGLVEELAAAFWETQRHGTLDDHPWDKAGPHWQYVFRNYARGALDVLRPPVDDRPI
jgi:hypothetical protein